MLNTSPRYVVLGLGVSGSSVASFLVNKNKPVFVFDDDPGKVSETVGMDNLGRILPFALDGDAAFAFSDDDVVVVSPGICCPQGGEVFHPVLLAARKAGATTVAPLDIFKQFSAYNTCLIGVTGSVGKSTVVTLIHRLMDSIGADVAMGGNIGIPYFDIKPFDAKHKVVELSSYELENGLDPSVNVGVLTNVFPHHLTRHVDFNRYVDAKLRMASVSSVLVLNADDVATDEIVLPKLREKFGEDYVKDNVRLFSANKVLPRGTSVIGSTLYINGEPFSIDVPDFMSHPHGLSNIACAVEGASVRCHIDPMRVSGALDGLLPLEHRNVSVGSVGNIKFVNDSKSTCHISTAAAISSKAKNVILIAGGKIDKSDQDLQKSLSLANPELMEPMKRVLQTFLIGEVSMHHREANARPTNFVLCEGLEDAFGNAVSFAEEAALRSPREDVFVLFSPGFQSFDQFKNFMHRGDVFTKMAVDYINAKGGEVVEKACMKVQ